MKKNGFTLVELLAVIVVLALLMTVAIPGVLTMSNKIQGNMFCAKVENIEKAAQLWGNDNYDTVYAASVTLKDLTKNTNVTHKNAKTVTVKELVQKGYQKKDDEEPKDGKSYVIDPRNDSSIMDNKVLVYIKNNRVYAEYQFNNLEDLNLCAD